MVATEVAVEVPAQAGPQPRPVSNVTLFGGFVGRTWLWFLGGCLVVTLLPLLFGWRPYVVESSSMAPRIKVGDVILAAPEHNPQKLLGRVTVFHDPDPGRVGDIKSHRVVAINSDGTLTTKGDANQSVDSVHVKVSAVVGLGRLLVRYVGLPLIWVQKGEWLKFALLIASIWFAALLVMRDRDVVEAPPEGDDPEADGGGSGPVEPSGQSTSRFPPQPRSAAGRFLPKPSADPDTTFSAAVVARPRHVRVDHPRRLAPTFAFRRFATRLARRTVYATVASLALLVPTAKAAFSATTLNTGDAWTVPTYNYTTETKNLGPYLYWKLDDTAGTTAADTSGNGRTGTYNSTWTKSQVGALTDQSPNLAVKATNAATRAANTSCIYTTSTTGMAVPGPMTYSEVIWFKTTSTTGGKLIGLGEQPHRCLRQLRCGRPVRPDDVHGRERGDLVRRLDWRGDRDPLRRRSQRRQLAHGDRHDEHNHRHVALHRRQAWSRQARTRHPRPRPRRASGGSAAATWPAGVATGPVPAHPETPRLTT